MKIEIGYKFKNKQEEFITVIDKYRVKNSIEKFICLFEDGTKIECYKPSIINKCLCNPNYYVNKVFNSKKSGKFQVIEKTINKRESDNSFLYKIKFLNTGGERYVRSAEILTGDILDLNLPHSVLKYYVGYGKYSIKEDLRPWEILRHICSKCYYIKDKRYNTNGAKGVTIYKEWLNFQIFAKFYYDNYWDCDYFLELDKDILANINHLETKIYSPETCILVPEELNCWLASDGPKSGVTKRNTKYRAKINNKTIKSFDSFSDAKRAYSEQKYKQWIELINKYKLPNNIKEILLKYDFSWSWIWENMTEEEILKEFYGCTC